MGYQLSGLAAAARMSMCAATVALLAACSDSPTEPAFGVLRLSVATAGVDLDVDGYAVTIDGREESVVPIDGEHVLMVSAGARRITLGDVATNCSISGEQERLVTVPKDGSVEVEFAVVCERAEKIAFTILGNPPRLAIGLADGSDRVELALLAHNPAWSPDGNRLVFSMVECDYYWYYDYECSGGLMLMDAETHAMTALGAGDLGYSPAWSPDGEHIAFVVFGDTPGKLHVARLDGSPATAIELPGVDYLASPTWSPDGQRLALACQFAGGRSDICIVNRDGTGLTLLTNDGHYDGDPAWRPDGSAIAFVTGRFPTGLSIALISVDGSEITRVTTGYEPSWSPDGTRLVFVRQGGLFTINSDGTDLRQITTGQHIAPAWRP